MTKIAVIEDHKKPFNQLIIKKTFSKAIALTIKNPRTGQNLTVIFKKDKDAFIYYILNLLRVAILKSKITGE